MAIMNEKITDTTVHAPMQWRVSGMDCASCAKTVERGVAELAGVEHVSVNFTTERLQVEGLVTDEALTDRVAKLGYTLQRETPIGSQAPVAAARTGLRGFADFVWQSRDRRIAFFAGLAALANLPFAWLSADTAVQNAVTAVFWIVTVIVGFPIARRGLRSLFYTRRITIDLLIGIATIGAIAIGASGEAVTVVLLYTLGEALEGYSAARSRDSLKALLGLRPDEATVILQHTEGHGDKHEDLHENEPHGNETHRHYMQRPVIQLAIGDHILVKPGERIPADGTIVDGTSGIDEAAITGESMPKLRTLGDSVSAGTINGDGTLEVEVARRSDDSTISRIAKLVEQAQAERSPAETFIDRFASVYTPAVVALAVLIAVFPPLVFGQPFLTPASGTPGWLYRGLALLIVACPCALIISIPVTVVSALTRMARIGILVKGGAQLDALASTRVFAFDKTGTLTQGRPSVAGIRSIACGHAQSSLESCDPCDDIVAMAAAVERGSNHPLAHAVLEAANDRSIQHRYGQASHITALTGRGVSGVVAGRHVTVGHEALFEPNEDVDGLLAGQTANTSSLMLVAEDGNVRGYIEVVDTVREESATALAALRELDNSYRFVMLTGDRADVAESIGEQLGGIDDVRAGLMPEDKLEAVRTLEREYGEVAMVGDGVNDTPALAGARLGIAMGGAGSHQAMEVADIVLMKDDLTQLPEAVAIAIKTRRLIRENIALSLGLKLAFLLLAIPGLATLWMAVLADVGTTVLVTLNGMRMLRAGRPRSEPSVPPGG